MNLLALNPIGSIIEAVGGVVGDLVTTDKERLSAELDMRKLGIEELKISADLVQGQLDVNKQEASHASVFVAGWRPAIGWVCASALAWQFLFYPMCLWLWGLGQATNLIPKELMPPPILDSAALTALVSSMLGIAGLRTFEKSRGVAS